MTTEQRKELTDNELIAQFMGFTCFETEHDRFYNPPEMPPASPQLWKYHKLDLDHFYPTSWDWLMPPCQKLMTLFKSMDNNETKFDDRVQFNFIRGHIERAIWNYLYSSGSIIDVHSGLAKAIKWYNSQAEYKR